MTYALKRRRAKKRARKRLHVWRAMRGRAVPFRFYPRPGETIQEEYKRCFIEWVRSQCTRRNPATSVDESLESVDSTGQGDC